MLYMEIDIKTLAEKLESSFKKKIRSQHGVIILLIITMAGGNQSDSDVSINMAVFVLCLIYRLCYRYTIFYIGMTGVFLY